MENPFFKAALDPGRGSIRSLVDKKSGRELVDTTAPHGFGQYLYERFDVQPGRRLCEGLRQDQRRLGHQRAGQAEPAPGEPGALSSRVAQELPRGNHAESHRNSCHDAE